MVILPAHVRNALIFNAALVIVIVSALSWYHATMRAELRSDLETRIADARDAYVALALELDRNRPTQEVEAIVTDCNSRAEFERLLDTLRTQSPVGLERASTLFDACGDYFALLRSVMSLHMDAQFRQIDTLYAIELQLMSQGSYDDLYAIWLRMRDVEQKRGALLREQVAAQRQIIDALRARANEEEITRVMERVRDVNGELAALATEADALREQERALWESQH